MRFEVEISEVAQIQYENILRYNGYKLKNPQAVMAVMDE